NACRDPAPQAANRRDRWGYTALDRRSAAAASPAYLLLVWPLIPLGSVVIEQAFSADQLLVEPSKRLLHDRATRTPLQQGGISYVERQDRLQVGGPLRRGRGCGARLVWRRHARTEQFGCVARSQRNRSRGRDRLL